MLRGIGRIGDLNFEVAEINVDVDAFGCGIGEDRNAAAGAELRFDSADGFAVDGGGGGASGIFPLKGHAVVVGSLIAEHFVGGAHGLWVFPVMQAIEESGVGEDSDGGAVAGFDADVRVLELGVAVEFGEFYFHTEGEVAIGDGGGCGNAVTVGPVGELRGAVNSDFILAEDVGIHAVVHGPPDGGGEVFKLLGEREILRGFGRGRRSRSGGGRRCRRR